MQIVFPFPARRAAGRRGIATVELALLLPLLLLFVFGMVDFGRFLLRHNEITNLSREAANLASRGTTFDETTRLVFDASGDMELERNGYLILTQIERDQNGNLVITKQQGNGDHAAPSRVGAAGGGSVVLPSGTNLPLQGQVLTVAEVFLTFAPVTPVGDLPFIGPTLPRLLYDVAYFY